MKKIVPLSAIALTLFFSAGFARALTETDASSDPLTFGELQFDGDITTDNLLYNQPITSSVSTSDGFALTGVVNGAASQNSATDQTFFDGNNGYGTTFFDNPVLTISLDTVASPTGYTLNEIQTIDGWQNIDQSWSDQSYSVYYSTVLAPTTFTLLATVNYHPFVDVADSNFDTDQRDVGESSEVTLSAITGISGVAALQFDLSPSYNSDGGDESGGVMIREFQAFGTPTELPEPSTWAMMIGGLLAMAGIHVIVRKHAVAA